MNLTTKQKRTLGWMKVGTTVREIKQIGADLYVRGNHPYCAWVIHPDEDKPWPTRWPKEIAEFPHGEYPNAAEVRTMSEPPTRWADDNEPDYNPN